MEHTSPNIPTNPIPNIPTRNWPWFPSAPPSPNPENRSHPKLRSHLLFPGIRESSWIPILLLIPILIPFPFLERINSGNSRIPMDPGELPGPIPIPNPIPTPGMWEQQESRLGSLGMAPFPWDIPRFPPSPGAIPGFSQIPPAPGIPPAQQLPTEHWEFCTIPKGNDPTTPNPPPAGSCPDNSQWEEFQRQIQGFVGSPHSREFPPVVLGKAALRDFHGPGARVRFPGNFFWRWDRCQGGILT